MSKGWAKLGQGLTERAKRGGAASTRAQGEGGFTLAELLVAVTILGIVIGALAAAFVVTAHDSIGITERLSESHDAQIASAYLATDVQSSNALVAGSCSSGTPVIAFGYSDGSTANYCYGGNTLTRDYSGSPSTSVTLVHHGGGTPTLTCVNPSGCAVGSKPTKVTIAINEAPSSSGPPYSYTLSGSMRSFLNPNGSNPAAHAALITLASGGTSVGVSGGTLAVNGKIVVNSTGTPAVSRSGGTLTSGGIQILQGGTCSGCSSTPFSPAIPDPFASVPQCPAAAGCPGGSGPGADVSKSSGSISPGVYHDLTINGNVSFAPGVYVVTDYFSVKSGAAGLNMAGVTFYFGCAGYPTPCTPGQLGGTFRFQQGDSETVTLSPVTTGDFAPTGIALFLDRNNVGILNGCDKTNTGITSGTTNITGALYAKSSCAFISGGGAVQGGIVAKQFQVTGGGMTIG